MKKMANASLNHTQNPPKKLSYLQREKKKNKGAKYNIKGGLLLLFVHLNSHFPPA